MLTFSGKLEAFLQSIPCGLELDGWPVKWQEVRVKFNCVQLQAHKGYLPMLALAKPT